MAASRRSAPPKPTPWSVESPTRAFACGRRLRGLSPLTLQSLRPVEYPSTKFLTGNRYRRRRLLSARWVPATARRLICREGRLFAHYLVIDDRVDHPTERHVRKLIRRGLPRDSAVLLN